MFTDDDELAESLRSVRVHGQGIDKYNNVRIGLNGRLDTLQAAILLPKLKAFPAELAARQDVARRYNDGLGNVVEVPFVPDEHLSAWAQYSVLSDKREQIQAALKEAGIPTAVYYPKPLHLQSAFAHLGQNEGDFPLSEGASQRIFSLPMHPYMDETTQRSIIDAVTTAVSESKGTPSKSA